MAEATADKATALGIWSVALMQAPGKIATLVGPLAVAAIFPYERYAIYEVIFSLSVLAAAIAGSGYGAAMPQRLIGAGDPGIFWLMRKRLWITACIAGVAFLCAMNAGQPDLALAASLCQGLIAQSYGAAYLRLQDRFFLSAFVEHLGWVGTCAISLLIFLHPPQAPWTSLVHAAAVTSLLATAISLGLLSRPKTPTRRVDERATMATALPFMVNQISSSSVTAAGRVSLFISGFILESAACSLAFRLAAPIVFFYQINYARRLRALFSPVVQNAHKARNRLILEISIASTGVAIVLSIAIGLQLPLVSRTSGLALFLAIQTLSWWSVAEVLGFSWAGTRRHLSYSLALLCSVALPLLFSSMASSDFMPPWIFTNFIMLATPATLLLMVIGAMNSTSTEGHGDFPKIAILSSSVVSGIFLIVLGGV